MKILILLIVSLMCVSGEAKYKGTPVPMKVEDVLCLSKLKEEVDKKPKIILYYSSKRCVLCSEMDDMLKVVRAKYKGLLHIKKLDALKSTSCAEVMGVFATPTMIFFKDGRVVVRGSGLPSKAELDRVISSFLSIKRVEK